MIAGRLDLWLATRAAGSPTSRPAPTGNSQAKRLQLASDAVAFDALATPLRYDMTGAERSAEAMATLRQHMLMFLPIVSAIADRIETLERAGALPQRLRSLLDDMAGWLASGTTDPAEAARLRQAGGDIDPAFGERAAWDELVVASLMARLADFIDLRQDARLLQRHIADGTPVTEELTFRYTAAARTIRHRDHGMALLSAVGVFLSILVTCAIWIATGWPDGARPDDGGGRLLLLRRPGRPRAASSASPTRPSSAPSARAPTCSRSCRLPPPSRCWPWRSRRASCCAGSS